ncbi:MAG: hypothetical protein A2Y34_09525 [Spirochaetes bacterium GWC1_27_15]|nr:MAG: hypothetical protein A2Y34_09525 [Spirochaetes bacterium GWC1_27_15]
MTSLDMTKTTENTTDFWQAKYTFSNKNVYGYYFEIYIDNYKRYISGAGEKISVAHYKLPKTGGRGVINSTLPNEGEFIQTVYDPNFKTPDWAKDIVFYYIFPDRFRNGSSANDPKQGVDHFYKSDKIEFHTNWADPKPWVPGSGDGHTTDDDEYCNDFYGGDLAGIKEKLDYLAELGVNTLYINPIFEASSNHKYDCANFKSIDNNFGTLEEFNDLCSVAQSKGIKIILDASLNHSSSDSIYMDRYSHYPNSLGAFEGEVKQSTSPYYDWYEWVSGETDPDKMYQIWAVPSLANLKDQTQSYKDFAINDSDSVTKYWLNQGSSGWRMDVAPWVSDSFWKEWRTAAKATKSDSYLVCETWWDSSKYFLGDMFDATMNYIFRQAVIDYSNGTKTAAQTNDILEMMREDYPEEAFYVLMNLLSTHDKPRALWHYGYLEQGASGYDTAVKKLKLSMLFQMTYPGAPSIYYGDEVGVTGGEDPYNRGPYPWADKGGNPDTNLFSQVKTMVKLRNDNPILRRGTIKPIYSDSNVMAYLRTYQGKTAIICVNNSDTNKEVTINLSGLGLPTTFSDILNSNTGYTVTNNQLKVTVNAYWGNVLMN